MLQRQPKERCGRRLLAAAMCTSDGRLAHFGIDSPQIVHLFGQKYDRIESKKFSKWVILFMTCFDKKYDQI